MGRRRDCTSPAEIVATGKSVNWCIENYFQDLDMVDLGKLE